MSVALCKTRNRLTSIPTEPQKEVGKHLLSEFWSKISDPNGHAHAYAQDFNTSQDSAVPHLRSNMWSHGDSSLKQRISSGPDCDAFKALIAAGGMSADAFGQIKQQYQSLSDATIMRHSIACDCNVDRVVKHLEDCVTWRLSYFSFGDTPKHQSVGEGCVWYTHGFDKLGHPLIHFTPRLQDLHTRDVDELVRWALFVIEVAIARLPPHLEQFTVMTNRLGMGEAADFEFPTKLFHLIDTYYPFRCHMLLSFPQTLSIMTVAGVVKRVTGKTSRNIHYHKTIESLRNDVPDQYIPAEMGGSCEYSFAPSDYPPPSTRQSGVSAHLSQ